MGRVVNSLTGGGDVEIHQGILCSAKFAGRNSFRKNWGKSFKGGGGATFLTSNATKYILEKVSYLEKYIFYKVAQTDKIFDKKSSLGGQSIYYKK